MTLDVGADAFYLQGGRLNGRCDRRHFSSAISITYARFRGTGAIVGILDRMRVHGRGELLDRI